MWCSKSLKYLLFLTVFIVNSCSAKEGTVLKAEQYIIYKEEKNAVASDYLYHHLQKRASASTFVLLKEKTKVDAKLPTAKHIYLTTDTQLKEEYCIDHQGAFLTIRVKNTATMTWIVYQLIEAIAQVDSRFNASDLMPAVLDFQTRCATHDFDYREPYYHNNLMVDQAGVAGNHNVELDWGIWGHNLSKVLSKVSDRSIYAQQGKQVDQTQYCFTSKALESYLTNYITDQFGTGDKQSYHFVITPQDNDVVCGCTSCMTLNKGTTDASESVAYLVNRLAKQFPKHQFFTLLYRTTNQVPKATLEDNVGVFVSTINLPKGVDLNGQNRSKPAVEQFVQQIEQWKAKTPLVYIWDYSANFDDYLSPIPVLYAFQKQIKFYKELGITGVFLNGSGYDYSTFDDVKNYVLGALMKDLNLSVDQLVRQYFDKFYPQNALLLTSYYLQLEKQYEQKNKSYALYGSASETLTTYLEEQTFITFYNQVKQAINTTTGNEYVLLKKLFVGLTFARMQIAYFKGYKENGIGRREGSLMHFLPENTDWINTLSEGVEQYQITQYKEADGSLKQYVQTWKAMIQKPEYENLLLGTDIIILSKVDEGFEQSTYLNNGLTGLPFDYHMGWYICSTDDIEVSFDTSKLQGIKQVTINFLIQAKHHFQAPEYITFWLDGHLVKTVYKNNLVEKEGIAKSLVEIDFTTSKTMQIKMVKSKTERVALACDEIQITNKIK